MNSTRKILVGVQSLRRGKQEARLIILMFLSETMTCEGLNGI